VSPATGDSPGRARFGRDGFHVLCRYLGQSLGAAIFGAIFNASLNGTLRAAPGSLKARLPHSVSGVSASIGRTSSLGPAAGYLRDAISAATHDVYVGLVVAGVLTIAAMGVIIPRRTATAGPGQAAGEPGPAAQPSP
jgi:hypothetical protein